MAITNLPGLGILFPEIPAAIAVVPTFTGDTINSSTPKKAFVFRVPKTGTIDTVELWFRTVSTPQDVKLSLQDIDPATGNPDGVIDQFRVMALADVTGTGWKVPGLLTSDGTDGGTKRDVTIGDTLCLVAEFDSTVGSIALGLVLKTGSIIGPHGLAFDRSFNGTSWSSGGSYPIMILKYSDGSYASPESMILPVTSATTRTYNSASTPDERGLYFSLPWEVSVSGAWVAMNLSGDATVTLYDTDGTTVLRSVTLDADTDSGITDIFPVRFATPVTLTAGGHYRITVVPTTGTNISTYEWGINSAALMAGFQGGTDMIGTSRADAGAWTEADTVRPIMGLILQGFHASESGGGGETSAVFG